MSAFLPLLREKQILGVPLMLDHSVVIAGLDPAIHLLSKSDGCAGQARA
jgi:hypothetical protein